MDAAAGDSSNTARWDGKALRAPPRSQQQKAEGAAALSPRTKEPTAQPSPRSPTASVGQRERSAARQQSESRAVLAPTCTSMLWGPPPRDAAVTPPSTAGTTTPSGCRGGSHHLFCPGTSSQSACEALRCFGTALWQTHCSAPGAVPGRGRCPTQSRKGLNHGAPCGLRSPHRLQDRAATRSRHPRKKRAHVEVTFPSATAHLGRSREKRSHITQRRCSDRPLLVPSLQPPALAAAPRRSSSRCLSPNPPNPPRSGLHAVPVQTPQHPAPLGTIEPPRLEEAQHRLTSAPVPALPHTPTSTAGDVVYKPTQSTKSVANAVYGQHGLQSDMAYCQRGLQPKQFMFNALYGQRNLRSTVLTVSHGLQSMRPTANAVYGYDHRWSV